MATGSLSQSAVAHVIALHLWDSGERPDSDVCLPRNLKDRIHRALAGEVMTPETLNWFISAFGMSPEDGGQLRARLLGGEPAWAGAVAGTLRSPAQLPLPQIHRTVAVFERRVIGPRRHAVTHHTTRAITACADTVRCYPCRQFPDAEHMRVLRGGTVTATHHRAGSAPVLEITLTTPLRRGQVTSLEYMADFGPRSGIAIDYRQVAHARAENVDIVVQFHQAARPRKLWWSVWDDYRQGRILDQETVSLDDDGCAHRYLPYLENAAAGFRWAW